MMILARNSTDSTSASVCASMFDKERRQLHVLERQGCASIMFLEISYITQVQPKKYPFPPTPPSPQKMSGAACCLIITAIIAVIIVIIFEFPPFGYIILAIVALFIIAAVCNCCMKRKSEGSPISPLLPTSAQQLEQAGLGDASDIPAPPNAPAFTWDHGRGESIVLQTPPPAVMRGIDIRDSYLGGSVTHSEPSTLPPVYMDGADR